MVNSYLKVVDGLKMLAKVMGTMAVSMLVIFLSVCLIAAICAALIIMFGYVPTVLLVSIMWLLGYLLITQYKPN
jgi:hypothetical protein